MSVNQFTIDRHKAYDVVKDEALCRHNNHESWTSICKDYGFDRDCFVNYLIRIGLVSKRSPRKIYLCDSILEQAYKEYINTGSSISNIAKKYGVYRKTLTKDLKQKYDLNILQDGKKQIDDHYFDIINSAEKAYWLGFLYADGYNDERGKIELALKEEDLSHIKKFKKAIQSKHKISYKSKTKAYRIAINSKLISKALTNHGCVNHKSYIMDIPTTIEDKYLSHFIRGYFDGDGCFYVRQKNSYQQGFISFVTGSEKFAHHFVTILSKFKVHAKEKFIQYRNIWTVYIIRQPDIKRFYDMIYDQAHDEIWLTRKYKKFNSWIIQKYFAV